MAPISNITMIPLSNLLFDPENPRLPKEFRGNRDEQAIIKHMLRDESLIELMKSNRVFGIGATPGCSGK